VVSIGSCRSSSHDAYSHIRFKLLIDGDDSEALVRTKALENGVLALPGTVFLPDGRKTAYVRASFSVIGEAEIDEACRRLGETLRVAKGM
jgi:tryptophan aminotransferase